MKCKLAFLGTGNCVSGGRNPSSFAISNGKEIALVDCGGGCYHQIGRIGDDFFSHEKITDVLLTHFHPDHTTGLVDILWGETWDPVSPRKEPLRLAGPVGLAGFVKECVHPLLGDHEIPFEILYHELAHEEILHGPFFTARSYKLAHTASSCGYCIETGKSRLGFTGDTGFCDNLLKLFSSSDLAVVEWSLSGNTHAPHHLSDGDIVRLLETDVLPKKVYFTHLYPSPEITMEQLIERKKKILGAKANQCFFPHDLEVVDL